ncbi:MAG: hypothetical protein PWQ55_2417 [Chloroflexota bacterium]|nr:hypothetical protein [Chloroflexota bacterium]
MIYGYELSISHFAPAKRFLTPSSYAAMIYGYELSISALCSCKALRSCPLRGVRLTLIQEPFLQDLVGGHGRNLQPTPFVLAQFADLAQPFVQIVIGDGGIVVQERIAGLPA